MNESLLHIFTSLGNAIFNSIWQSGLIWLLVLIFIKLNRNASCFQISSLAFIATIAGFISFIATFLYTVFFAGESHAFAVLITNISWLHTSLPYIAAAYLVALLFHLARLVTGLKTVYILKNKHLSKVPGHIKIFTLDAISYLGIKRKVKIFVSGIISSPATIGFIKPVILLPVALINHLSMQQVESVILHELAHIKQNDYLKNFINRVIATAMYFNPFIKNLIKMQDAEREKSADDWVMRFEYNKTQYASALFSLATLRSGIKNELSIPASGKNTTLLQRIEWLLGNKKREFPGLKIMLASTLLIVTFLFFSMQKYDAPIGQKTLLTASNEKSFTAKPVAFVTQNTSTESKIQTKQIQPKIRIAKNSEPANDGNYEEQNTEPVYPAIFQAVSATTPMLSENEEKNIKASVNASKKILAEENWQQIELQLAETMTDEQKLKFKKLYGQYINQAEWTALENKLRLNYKNINWDSTTLKLNLAMASIQLDSIYKNYTIALQNLLALKKDFASSKDSLTLSIINKKYTATKNLINYVDSIRRKRIVEL